MRFRLITAFFCLITSLLQAQVTFRLNSLPAKYTPALDTLFIAGDFNSWNPRNAASRFQKNTLGQLEATVTSAQANLQYKITRGSWATVEVAANGLDIPNRQSPNTPGSTVVLDVADWADTKGSHTSQAGVQILTSQLWLRNLKRYRRIWVNLPGDYQTNTSRIYPVMYFHDGQNVFDAATSFAGEWKVDEAMIQLESQAGWEPVIAVGIDNGGSDRLSELTPFRHPTYEGGAGELYAKDVVECVKPLIDSLFRTKKDKAHTAIGGSSLGGIETLYMAYAYPSVFSKALIFSPSLWFSDSLRQYCLAQPQPTESKLYWVCGTNEGDPDMVPDLNQCYADLLAAGMPASQMSKAVVTGGTHSEGFWSSQVKAGISWLFGSATTAVKKNESGIQPEVEVWKEGNVIHIGIESQSLENVDYQIFDLSGRELVSGKIGRDPVQFTSSYDLMMVYVKVGGLGFTKVL